MNKYVAATILHTVILRASENVFVSVRITQFV